MTSLDKLANEFKNLLKEIVNNINNLKLGDKQLEISTKIDAILYLLENDAMKKLAIAEVIKLVKKKEEDAMLISNLNFKNKYDVILMENGISEIFSGKYVIDDKYKEDIDKYSFMEDIIISQLRNINKNNEKVMTLSFNLIRNTVDLITSKHSKEELNILAMKSIHKRHMNFIEQLTSIRDESQLKPNIIPFFQKLESNELPLIVEYLEEYVNKEKKIKKNNDPIENYGNISDYISNVELKMKDNNKECKIFAKWILANVKKFFKL